MCLELNTQLIVFIACIIRDVQLGQKKIMYNNYYKVMTLLRKY